jgi:Ran GTPase-activating protein (RanGAP) involved in mRNA processing and transport
LATQGKIVVASHLSSLVAHDNATNAPGLLQYHPNIHVWGPWKTLKRIPDAMMRNMVHLHIHNRLGLAKSLEKVFTSTSRLRELFISHGSIKSTTAVRLFRALGERERVAGAQGLQTLYVELSKFGKKTADQLSAYLANASSLEHLTLCDCTFKMDTLQSLADGLVQNRTITVLDLDGTNLGLRPEIALSKILRGCPTLTTLDLSDTFYGRETPSHSAELADAILSGNCNLKSLSVERNWIGSEGASELAPAISKLQNLKVSNNNIGIDGIRAIGEAVKTSKTITNLSINNNYGIAYVIESFSAGIASNKSLQILELFGCKIGTAGLRQLSAVLVGKVAMRELYLYNNCIDDAGCQYVVEILVGCSALEVLELGWNKIGSAGVRTLVAALPQAKHLQKLMLCGNGAVDDPSTAALFEAVHGHPSLSYIAIYASDSNFHIGELATPVLEALKPGTIFMS